MSRLINRFQSKCRDFSQDRRGVVAIMFVIVAVPMLGVTALAVDFSRASTAKTSLQAAADAAALAAAKADPASEDGVALGKAVFNAYVYRLKSSITVNSVSVKVETTTDGRHSVVEFAAKTPSIFPTAITDDGSFNMSGIAKAFLPIAIKADIIALVDNSVSMGLMANEAGRDWLDNKVGCAFACHVGGPGHEYNGKTYYQVAKEGGWQTRFDIVVSNLKNMLGFIDANKKDYTNVRFGMYSINDGYKKELEPTTDLFKAKQVVTDFKLAYQWTRFERYFEKVTNEIGISGNGMDSPKKFVVLVTDGVRSSWDWGNAGFHAFKPQWCDGMKKNGVTVVVLYTRYVPMPKNGTYNALVAPWYSTLEPNMRACASPGMFYPATEDKEIALAFTKILEAFKGQMRLTN